MTYDPIRYTGGAASGYSTTILLVRLRRDSLRETCQPGFGDLPEEFVKLMGTGELRDAGICPAFLMAKSLLGEACKAPEDLIGRLRKGVAEYVPNDLYLLGHRCGPSGYSYGDLVQLVTHFRLRFATPGEAQAAYKRLKASAVVQAVEWWPLRVIAVPVLRGRTDFAPPAAAAAAGGGADIQQRQAGDGGILQEVRELRDLVAALKTCACEKKTAASVPDPEWAAWGLAAVNAPVDRDRGKDAVIAMLDLGADRHHPDLKDRVEPGMSNVPPGTALAKAVDGTAYGAAFALNPDYPRGHHGTAVAGIIAGSKYGVLPKAKLVSFQVAAEKPYEGVDGAGRPVRYYPVDPVLYASALFTLAHAPSQVSVLNMSIGGQAPLCELEDTALGLVAAQGILLVSSSGNNSRPGDYAGVMYPARDPRVLSVGAVGVEKTTSFYKHASFSNYDADDYRVNVVAPGVEIYKCVPEFVDPDLYGWGDGTSYASPFVAGIAGHAIGKHGAFEPQNHTVKLKYQAADRDFDERHGWGLVKWVE